jgi:hypothetical protein
LLQAPQAAQQVAAHGDMVARLMQLQLLAEATALALVQGRRLYASDEAALLAMMPWLLRLAAICPTASSASPFALEASQLLACRPDASDATAAASYSFPAATQRQPGSATLCFEVEAAPSPAAANVQAAEMQTFAQQVIRGIEQSSKEAMEGALSEISRHPSCTAIVRGSIEGQLESVHSLRSLVLRHSGSLGSPCDSLGGTPRRWSLNLGCPSVEGHQITA